MAGNSSEVKIKIAADGNEAVGVIGRVVRSIRGMSDTTRAVVRGVGSVMSAFSKLSWVVSGVQLVVEGVRRLHDWTNRAATAARELAAKLERTSAATAAATAAAAYAKLNKELAEANRLEKERNAILDGRKARARDIEDARAEQDKQIELSRLDPNSATYEQDKAEIGRKYERRASERAAERAGEDSREGAKRLYGEADRIDRQADDVQKRYERQMRAADRYREISRQSEMEARAASRDGDDDDAKAKKEKAEKDHAEWEKAHDAAVRMREAMEALRAEAETLRNRAGEMTGGGYAARIRNEAEQTRIDNEAREDEAARRKREDEARRQLEKEREIAKLDPASETYDEDRKEIERRNKQQPAANEQQPTSREPQTEKTIERDRVEKSQVERDNTEKLVERDNTEKLVERDDTEKLVEKTAGKLVERDNTEKTVERRDKQQPAANEQQPTSREPQTEAEIRAEAERIRIENQRRAEAHGEWKAESLKRDSEKLATLRSALSSLADSDSVSQNRLTAMGLGSGVSATGGNRAELKEIIGLIKKQIDATKGIKTGKSRYEE